MRPRPYSKANLHNLPIPVLREIAKKSDCKGYSKLRKDELVDFVHGCQSRTDLKGVKVEALREYAKALGCGGQSTRKTKAELIAFIKSCEATPSYERKKVRRGAGVRIREVCEDMNVKELREEASRLNIHGRSTMKRAELVKSICGTRDLYGNRTGHRTEPMKGHTPRHHTHPRKGAKYSLAMSLDELKHMAAQKGLKTTGTKKQLLARLRAKDRRDRKKRPPLPTTLPPPLRGRRVRVPSRPPPRPPMM